MPITVVGRPAIFKGRAIIQILTNLQKFGIGRIIRRFSFDNYPEPSFFRIVKVEPAMDSENINGKVWADTIFRGRHLGIAEIEGSHHLDYYLVHKEDEESLINFKVEVPEVKIMPRTGQLPPLVRAMIIDDRKRQGLPVTVEPYMDMTYRDNVSKRYRMAEIGETPNVKFTKHLKWEFYEDVMEIPKTVD